VVAVRVRKLAKELQIEPGRVLALLHHLGFSRYRRSDDMVADGIAQKVRREARNASTLDPFEPEDAASPSSLSSQPNASTADWMGSVVPGVRPLGGRDASRPKPAPNFARTEEPPPDAEPIGEEDTSWADHDEAQTVPWVEERAQFERERSEWERERQALAQASETEAVERVSWLDLLEGRGLKGMQECEQAIAGLASRGLLRSAIEEATLSSGDLFKELLETEVKLCEGETPSAFSEGVVVRVTPGRGEIPTAGQVSTWLQRMGEGCLLRGWRRLVCIGDGSGWQKLLGPGLDPRVEMAIRIVEEPITVDDLQGLGVVGSAVCLVDHPVADEVLDALNERCEAVFALPSRDPVEVLQAWVHFLESQDAD
jgi:hypothetical protein